MKPAPSKTAQSLPEAKPSWADVARVSAAITSENASTSAVQLLGTSEQAPSTLANTFPGGSALHAGDEVQHEKFGRCTVHRIVSGFVHMAPVNGRVIKLSQNIVTFTPAFVEDGRRVFSTSTRQ